MSLAAQTARQRIEHLYRIGERLASFETIERTFSDTLKVASETLNLRSAILIIQRDAQSRTVVWPAEGVSAESVARAEVHAQRVHEYLGGVRIDASETVPRVLPPVPSETEWDAVRDNYIVLPLVADHRRTFGVMQMEGTAAFDESDLQFINVIANQFAVALDRTLAWQHEVALRERFSVLAEVGARLVASLDYTTTLPHALSLLVPRVADQGVFVVATEPRLRFVEGEPRESAAMRYIEARVVATAEILACPEIAETSACDDEARALMAAEGVHSIIGVPLRAYGQTVGAIVLASSTSGRIFGSADLLLARELAYRIAMAIDNARLYGDALEAIRSRDNLLSVVSHDLKNPLSAILMNATFLLEKPAPPHERRRYGRKQIESVMRASERMSRLVDDLLDIASMDAGRLSLQRGPTALGPLIEEALESLAPLAADKSVRLEIELPSEMPVVTADSARIHQVLANIIGNAIKFTPVQGTITVRCEWREGEVLFAIEDAGPGIRAEEIPHLFDRFWQARRTAHLGTGLGLFIAKSLVLAHGGRIWVENRVGSGATFFFTLPFVPPAPQSLESASPSLH